MDADRARKLADRIAQIVAEMLERRVKDPRLGFVTVTDARLTGDLREATVYYTVYGSEQDRAGTAAALKSATGLIRSEVGRQTGLRHTPSLSFVPDTLPEGARHLEELVEQARAADAAVAAARQGAQPAGDPDPYRVPGRAVGDDAGFDDEPDDEVTGAGDPEEAYPDQAYPGDPGRWESGPGSGVLGRNYPAAPGGHGRGGTARWQR